MIAPRFIAGFAGHRDRFHQHKIAEVLQKVWRDLREKVASRGGKLEVCSSIAYGADTIAVEKARAESLPVHLILPKPVVMLADGSVNQKAGFAADFWTGEVDDKNAKFRENDWQRCFAQISAASSGVNGGTLRVTHDSKSQPECYHAAGLEMLEDCDVLVVVWDGKKSAGLGGTAQMAEHAREIGLPRIIIAADTGQISEERMEKFAATGNLKTIH